MSEKQDSVDANSVTESSKAYVLPSQTELNKVHKSKFRTALGKPRKLYVLLCVVVVLLIIICGIVAGIVVSAMGLKKPQRVPIYFPNQTSCGDSFVLNGTAISRIINGQTAIPHAFPWMASLRLLSITNTVSSHFCGATLIFSQYVLTAAHCVQSIPANKLAVVLGIHSMTDSLTDANKYAVANVIAHENYDPINILNDIAILRLSRPVAAFTNKISPICLPPLDTSMDKKDAMAIGWGSVTGFKTKNSLATQLQQTHITVFESLADCNKSTSFNPAINFCAFNSINSNICFGDSGGPLIYFNGTKWLIHGVSSYIIGNPNMCEPKYPSYFTKVPNYLNWIADTINQFQ